MYKSSLFFIRHEILTTLRQAYAWLTPLLFFVIIVCLFPLSVGPDNVLLEKISPGIIWVSALLAILISIGNLFRQDEKEGFLDLLRSSHQSLPLLIFYKILCHWMIYCLPLIIISPLLGILLNLKSSEQYILILTLLLGTPTLTLLGAIGAALTVSLQSSGLLLPILIMPLYIPVLIFGTAAVMAVHLHQSIDSYMALLGALLIFNLGFSPWITAMALKLYE